MKKKELIEIIRFAVRKELKECLPAIIKECVNSTPEPKLKKKLVQAFDPVELVKQVLTKESKVQVSSPTKKKKTIRYAKDPVLNEVLNATVGGVPQEGGGGVSPDGTPEGYMTDLNGNEVNIEDLPDPLTNALTRDYSDLMGAINKKRTGALT